MLRGCLILFGLLVLAVGCFVVWLAGSSHQANPFLTCERQGSASIRIGPHVFTVPRNILSGVVLPGGQYDRTWRCNDAQIVAQSFYISADLSGLTRAEFDKWTQGDKLPHDIEVVRRGRIKSYADQFLRSAKERGRTSFVDRFGYSVTESGPEFLFDASPLGLSGHNGHNIVFRCSKITNPVGGSTCETSYPYDDAIDVSYSFDRSRVPENEWVELDGRFRALLEGMRSKR